MDNNNINNDDRFKNPYYGTGYFGHEILVKCPSCCNKGLVRRKINYSENTYTCTFNCTVCSLTYKFTKRRFVHRRIDNTWYGPVSGCIFEHCKFCGSKLSSKKYSVVARREKKEEIKPVSVKCNNCQKDREYELFWYGYPGSKPKDPFFGMDLWLQIPVKKNILWAYNIEHINYLQEYIDAKLRNNSYSNSSYSLAWNLPRWMVLGKNRELIINKLFKLEEKARK